MLLLTMHIETTVHSTGGAFVIDEELCDSCSTQFVAINRQFIGILFTVAVMTVWLAVSGSR